MLSERCLSVCLSCLSVCLSVTLVYCGQTVGLIKMKLGTEVGLVPGNIVLDGDPSEFFWGDGPSPPPQKKGGTAVSCPPLFGPCIVVKRLDGSRCHLVHWPRPHCVRWGPNSPSKRGLYRPNRRPTSRSKTHVQKAHPWDVD